MTHLWVRSEQRANEERVGLTPEGAASLIAVGIDVTVELSATRAIPIDGYRAAGCSIAPEFSWPQAPRDALIFGLKELPDDGSPLVHHHIMFGHAFKGQPEGRALLNRFSAGGGTLYDLEYLVREDGRRVAAFGFWAGFAGAAVSLGCWVAQVQGSICGTVTTYHSAEAMKGSVGDLLTGSGKPKPKVLIIGALGRVGAGAATLCEELGIVVTKWDLAETAQGGPFPEVLAHDILLNCILARPGAPVFVAKNALTAARRLAVIGDIACDPTSDFSPIKVYGHTTTWQDPALRVHCDPPLDVMAIDNLPAMLPVESSQDFAAQLLPSLLKLGNLSSGVWSRAKAEFDIHIAEV